MNFKRIYAILLKQLFLIRHNKTRLLNIFGWIVVDIILWGFITKYLDTVGQSGFNFTTVFLGAIILWEFFIRIYQGVIVTFFEDMWSRNFLNLFASPLSIQEYVTGLVSASLITSAAGFGAVFFIAYFFFVYNIFQLGIWLVPFLGILTIFGLALGIFTTALVLRFGPPAEWFAWIIPFILSPLSAIFYPLSVLPGFLQFISRIIPLPYVFEGMRSVVIEGRLLTSSLIVGFIIALIYLVAAYLFFTYIYSVVLRKGLISRFTAEDF